MELNLRKVAAYIRQADTTELLDRMTVYRDGMEPAALDLIEGELSRRGVSAEAIADHAEARNETVVLDGTGQARRCQFCDRPAVRRERGWYRLWGRLPIFPRVFSRCEDH